MAPKKKVEEAPPVEEEPEEEVKDRPLWVYGINDHLDVTVPDPQKLSGNLRHDFTKLCDKCGVVPHSAFKEPEKVKVEPPEPVEGEEPPPPPEPVLDAVDRTGVLAVSSILLDRVTVEILAKVLPKAMTTTLRFTHCALDTDMVTMLAAAAKDSMLRTLHLDWNPLELALEIPDTEESPLTPDRIDELERARQEQQDTRLLTLFARTLCRRHGSVESAVEHSMAVHHDTREWIDLPGWAEVLQAGGLPPDDCDEAVFILDSIRFGDEGGMKLETFIERLNSYVPSPPAEGDAEPAPDVLGPAFAALFTTIENLSFRSCKLTHLELKPISAALATSLHLQRLNLWSNRLDDESADLLARALVENHTLEYLGLGQNRISHVGLQAICHVCGMQVEDGTEAAAKVKEQEARKAGQVKAPPPKPVDLKDQPRYVGEQAHVDVLHDFAQAPLEEGGEPAGPPRKVWFRNIELRCLDLSGNEVKDRAVVEAALRWGYRAPRVLLASNPVADSLRSSPLPAPAVLPEIPEVELGWVVDL